LYLALNFNHKVKFQDINGFKGIRYYLNEKFDPSTFSNPTATGLLLTVAPGVLMTPLSSILEACNVSHSNPEPLYKRWTRGLIPRCSREVIFGIGLNQLSDYCEERVPYFENPTIKNALASISAGIVSGYFSHLVHNMSTLKLMNPNKTYWNHFREYAEKNESRIPPSFPVESRKIASYIISCVLPRGLAIRTGQIVGSFVILNGTINYMQSWMNS